MAGTSGGTGQPNVHAACRMAEARRVAQAYQPNPKLDALAVAGSGGSAWPTSSPIWSWTATGSARPATRTAPAPSALGGDLTALWDYDQDKEEWSEDYCLEEPDVTVSNFLTGSIERFVDQVVQDADTDPVKHMRPGRAAAVAPFARRGADGILAVAGRRIPGRTRLGHRGTER